MLNLNGKTLSEVITRQDVQKGSFSKAAGPLARGAYTVVREQYKGSTRLCEPAMARQGTPAGLSAEASAKVDGLFQHPA